MTAEWYLAQTITFYTIIRNTLKYLLYEFISLSILTCACTQTDCIFTVRNSLLNSRMCICPNKHIFCLNHILYNHCTPYAQTHRETLQNLVERMYALFLSRFVQEQEGDSLRETLDRCIKLLHKCCEYNYTQDWTSILSKRQCHCLVGAAG